MRSIIAGGLFLAGVIHLLPLSGVLGSSQLSKLYGVHIEDPGLALLMGHRAVLFGLLGLLLLVAAFHPPLRTLAFIAGLVSVVSFLVLAAAPGASLTPEIRRVVAADWVALVGLASGAAATVIERRRSAGNRGAETRPGQVA
jgi:hypothetical protein